MDRESKGAGTWILRGLGAVALALLPWLLDKLQVFERIAPRLADFLSSDVSFPGWLGLTFVIAVLLHIVASFRLALEFTELQSSRSIQVTEAEPDVQRLSATERSLATILRLSQTLMSEEAIIRSLSMPGGLTAPQVSAALVSLRQKELVGFRVIERVALYSLTQKGFDTLEQLEQMG